MEQNRGAYGLPTNALVSLAFVQCMVQGVLIPMLTTFLTAKSDHQPWFKIYVVFVNVLSLGQTIIHIIQAFDVMNAISEHVVLVAAAPILTGLIGAPVQAFFAYRCWRIYHHRILAMIPLLLLWLISLVSTITMHDRLGVRRIIRHLEPTYQVGGIVTVNFGLALIQDYLPAAIWIISSLLFDLITTSSTIVYLFHVRTELNANRSALVMVWNIIWASAAPPFALIIVTLIDGYAIESSGVASTMAAAMSGKFFVLSLMINLVGQGYIRRQFEQPYPSPGNVYSSRSQTGETVTTGPAAHTTDVELLPRTSLRVGASDNGSGKYHPDNASTKSLSIVKQEEGDLDHTVHTIQFASEPNS